MFQVIRENPASRGTETSAEVLVGPPEVKPRDGVERRSTAPDSSGFFVVNY